MFGPGYRGPILLGLLLAGILLAPWGITHGLAMVAALVLVFGYPFSLGMVLVLPTLLLWGAVLVAVPSLRRRLRRPGNSVLACCALAAVAAITAGSLPQPNLGLLGLSLITVLVLAVAWPAWQLPSRMTGRGEPRGWWRWAVPPLMLAVTVALLHYDVPREARFAAGRPALAAFAEEALAKGTVSTEQQWVGVYAVEDAELVDGGVRFAVSIQTLGEYGYAYFPNGVPPKRADYYRHLEGPWYGWRGSTL
ncbi:hypothetical protein [Kitasatospora camelliae]|uniref:Uncharacterized protein n=1 Tax=Kitasatospora camelliae TaxID=3156397 RepID=A0AAU8JZQ3_9ACTN